MRAAFPRSAALGAISCVLVLIGCDEKPASAGVASVPAEGSSGREREARRESATPPCVPAEGTVVRSSFIATEACQVLGVDVSEGEGNETQSPSTVLVVQKLLCGVALRVQTAVLTAGEDESIDVKVQGGVDVPSPFREATIGLTGRGLAVVGYGQQARGASRGMWVSVRGSESATDWVSDVGAWGPPVGRRSLIMGGPRTVVMLSGNVENDDHAIVRVSMDNTTVVAKDIPWRAFLSSASQDSFVCASQRGLGPNSEGALLRRYSTSGLVLSQRALLTAKDALIYDMLTSMEGTGRAVFSGHGSARRLADGVSWGSPS